MREVFPPPVDPEGLRPEISAVYDPVILDWKDLNPAVIDVMNVAQWKMDIFLLFFVVSIAFGILNTIQMSIQERIREFGVLLAIGTGQRNLMTMILWEVFLLIVPGVLFGILGAAIVGQYLHYHPIELWGVLAEVYESMGIPARYKPIVEIGELWTTSMSLILPSFLAGLFAARRVFRLDPVSAINII
jgi:ABC-type antimicrobial peptide transport system permease subunit